MCNVSKLTMTVNLGWIKIKVMHSLKRNEASTIFLTLNRPLVLDFHRVFTRRTSEKSQKPTTLLKVSPNHDDAQNWHNRRNAKRLGMSGALTSWAWGTHLLDCPLLSKVQKDPISNYWGGFLRQGSRSLNRRWQIIRYGVQKLSLRKRSPIMACPCYRDAATETSRQIH